MTLGDWTYNAGTPPYLTSDDAPQWTNSTGGPLGPFDGVALWGVVGGVEELIWVTTLDDAVSVPAGDVLRIPAGLRFELVSV